jgi:hypothetical protein
MTHFGRRFKTAFGLSPRDYRKRSFESSRQSGVREVTVHGGDRSGPFADR